MAMTQLSSLPTSQADLRGNLTQPQSMLNLGSCSTCGQPQSRALKFCTNCGSAIQSAPANYQNNYQTGYISQKVVVHQAPVFAKVHGNQPHEIPKQLQEELGKLLITIARERLFLYFHWLVFLAVHLLGFYLAYLLYVGYNADELTRIVLSGTAIMFINLSAFFCLPPIKSTRREIARLKEQLTYLHYQIEYRHLGY
jgi:hypothetical protein